MTKFKITLAKQKKNDKEVYSDSRWSGIVWGASRDRGAAVAIGRST